MITGGSMRLQDVCTRMHAFVEKNGWYRSDSDKPQLPRTLAASISIEAAELLEHFQWNDTYSVDAIADELADIILYVAQLANVLHIDLTSSLARKLDINDARAFGGRVAPSP